jgi:hypothetical protein
MKKLFAAIVCGLAVSTTATAGSILFNFDNVPQHTTLPIDLTVDGLSAHLSATGQGFSIQSADVLGFTPAGFSGNSIYPNSVLAADLIVSFSQSLTDFSIMYAPEEYATDSSATMKVSAYLNGAVVGSSTAVAYPPGTWPTGTLAYTAPLGAEFNSVVIHYESPPPTGGDWGPIFMADNMIVTPLAAAVPEPWSLTLLGVGAIGAIASVRARRRTR